MNLLGTRVDSVPDKERL